ncbi:MAG: hypothetical protein ACK5H1_08845 [Tenacibaculum sp.]
MRRNFALPLPYTHILLFVLSIFFISCGTIQTVSNNNADGIYNDEYEAIAQTTPQRRIIVTDDENYDDYEENYFTKELERLESLNSSDVFTDIEGYQSFTAEDDEIGDSDILNDNYESRIEYNPNAPWGYNTNNSDLVINVNTLPWGYYNNYWNWGWGWNGYGYNNLWWGYYNHYPWGVGLWYSPFYRYNWGWGYNNYYYSPYYGYSYYNPYSFYNQRHRPYYYKKRATPYKSRSRKSYRSRTDSRHSNAYRGRTNKKYAGKASKRGYQANKYAPKRSARKPKTNPYSTRRYNNYSNKSKANKQQKSYSSSSKGKGNIRRNSNKNYTQPRSRSATSRRSYTPSRSRAYTSRSHSSGSRSSRGRR